MYFRDFFRMCSGLTSLGLAAEVNLKYGFSNLCEVPYREISTPFLTIMLCVGFLFPLALLECSIWVKGRESNFVSFLEGIEDDE